MPDKPFPELLREQVLTNRETQGPFNSAHEAKAVIDEELEEFWDEVKMKNRERNPERMLAELIDIAASCQCAAEDLDFCEVDSIVEETKEQLVKNKFEEIRKLIRRWVNTAEESERPKHQRGLPGEKGYKIFVNKEDVETIRVILNESIYTPTCTQS